jgi:hypothetical protein
MQGIPSNTAPNRSVARFRHAFLVIGSMAAVAAASLMAAAPAAAVASFPIVVTVNGDSNPADHMEGAVSTFAPIATFTDDNACSAPGVCNLGTDYNVNIRWGDNTTADNVRANFISQNGTTAQGNYTASSVTHAWADENNNCPPPPPCAPNGFIVQILVTNKINLTTSDPSTFGQIAVKDAPLVSGSGFTFTANDQTQFTKNIGSFQDKNKLATAAGSGVPGDLTEYHISINWGDSLIDDTSTGTANVVTATPCPANCTVNVSGTHTYAHYGQYTVSVTVTDGSAPTGINFQSTADVFESRFPVNQTGAGTSGSRDTNQAPAGTSGPRIAHVGLGVRGRVATSTSSSSSSTRAQAIDLNWFDAMVRVLQGPAALQQMVR